MRTGRRDVERSRWAPVGPLAVTAVVAAAIALPIAGCGGGDSTEASASNSKGGSLVLDGETVAGPALWKQAQEEGSITLYTSISPDREEAIDNVFTEQTGIDVHLIQGVGSETYQRVLSELSAGKLEADVIRQTDVTLAEEEQEKGVWAEYCPAAESELPKAAIGEKCRYWAPIQDVYAIAYNTELVDEKEAPKSWDDLLDPKWKGKIGLPYIGAGGSTWARDLFLRKTKGLDYWEKLAAQDPVLSDQVSTTTDQLVQGQVEVAMDVPPTAGALMKEGAPLAVVMPSDGAPSYAAWTGMAAEASNPAAAKVFLNWNASKAGQKAIAEVAGDYPVRPGTPPPTIGEGETLPALEEAKVAFPEQWPEYVSKRDPYNSEWLKIFNYSP
jgi:iron(III) transport system substrate-binding protein